jgi:hypothetical protein
MHTLEHGMWMICTEKHGKMRNTHLRTRYVNELRWKHGIWETYRIEHGIWGCCTEKQIMRNAQCRIWNKSELQ